MNRLFLLLCIAVLPVVTGCGIVGAAGDTVEATGEGVGHAAGAIGEGAGHAVRGTGRAVDSATDWDD